MKRAVAVLLVLVVVSSVVSPAMAAQQNKTLSSGQIKKIWDEWPHKNGEVRILWTQYTHQWIAFKAGEAMNMGQPYLTIFWNYSAAPDDEDWGWDRFYKHVYDPYYNWGGAPDACKEKVDSAIYYAVWGGDLEMAYQELGRASHYLMDVGNPYHSSLWPPDKVRHDFYESLVHSKFDDQDSWGLKSIAYNAPLISISDPKQAVKDLASYSRQYRDELDSLIKIDPYTNTPYIPPENLDQVKQITQDLVRKTAGYVKGLIGYYNENAYSTPLGVSK
jgi:hypothetical protein